MARGNAGARRRLGDGRRTPYPFVYSRDAWDVRRFNPLGRAPGAHMPSRWAMRFAVALIVAVLGGSLILAIALMAQALFH